MCLRRPYFSEGVAELRATIISDWRGCSESRHSYYTCLLFVVGIIRSHCAHCHVLTGGKLCQDLEFFGVRGWERWSLRCGHGVRELGSEVCSWRRGCPWRRPVCCFSRGRGCRPSSPLICYRPCTPTLVRVKSLPCTCKCARCQGSKKNWDTFISFQLEWHRLIWGVPCI